MCLQDVDYEEYLEYDLHRGLYEDLYDATGSSFLHKMCAILGDEGLRTSPPGVNSTDPGEDLKWSISANRRCLLEHRKDVSWRQIEPGSQSRWNTVDFYFRTPTHTGSLESLSAKVTLGPDTTFGDIVVELQEIFLNAVRAGARERKTNILAAINLIRMVEKLEVQIKVMRIASRQRRFEELEYERWTNIACTIGAGCVTLSILALCAWLFLRVVTAA